MFSWYQHYIWASGHFILLTASIRYLLAWVTLKTISAFWYKGLWLARFQRTVPNTARSYFLFVLSLCPDDVVSPLHLCISPGLLDEQLV